ncbi:MAG: cellulose biosynthesis protein BcsS [Hyphomicrobium sp.]
MLIVSTSSATAETPFHGPWLETWVGADASSSVWLLYSGATVAPWTTIYDDGWRLRAAAGYGGYSYTRAPEAPGGPRRKFAATSSYTELLGGYQKRFGEVTAKAFAGISMISHDIRPIDTETIVIGADVGVKGALELWVNLGPNAWVSLDVAVAQPHQTRSVHARAAYRVTPPLSLGIDVSLNVDGQATIAQRREDAELLDFGRVGAFASYQWGSGEVSLSAGALGSSLEEAGSLELAPYANINWLSRF